MRDIDLIDSTLVFRRRKPTDPFNADTWASESQASFIELTTRTVVLASTYLLARLMRWLRAPTAATYAAIPALIRPTIRQRMESHPASIDLTALPSLGDALVARRFDGARADSPVDAIVHAGVDISWPFSIHEALAHVRKDGAQQTESDTDDRLYILPQFAAHISNPQHWVLGQSLLNEYPELAGSDIMISNESTLRFVDKWL